MTVLIYTCLVVFCTGVALALPSPVLQKLDDGLRYQYAEDSLGKHHLVDTWLTLDNVAAAARFNPSRTNVYHLFTRENPTLSQPLVMGNAGLLQLTNYKSDRRTIVLVHGWRGSVTADFNTVLIPAFLAAEDVNVIVVDWSAGSSAFDYRVVMANTITSARAVADFITWLNEHSQSETSQYHIVGHGFGGHQAGIIGRNLGRTVAYITGLDPALVGWVNNIFRFQRYDGRYTEVIHTNYGVNGYLGDLGQVDFYPNRGISMPGCSSNACDHARSFFYFAESLVTGGFTGRQCFSYATAVVGLCDMPGRLQMGGLRPKTGSAGVYLVETNASSPFSMG